MTTANQEALVPTDWLAANLDGPRVRVLDATWFLPGDGRDGRAMYLEQHIPDAVFFDIDAIAAPGTDLPHMLPSANDFATAVGGLGIANEHHVVVYDAHGIFSAPRVWWTFRVFGHDRVSVLDGGLPKWQREGRAVEAGHRDVIPARYRPTLRPELVRTLAQMQANLVTGVATVVDARPPGRFRGTEPEPRAGLRGGHIPRSVNVISSDLVDPETGTLVDRNRMRHVFAAGGTPVDEPLIATCGSGVAASVLALGLHLLGHDEWAVYDGSWTEWGGRDDTPVEV